MNNTEAKTFHDSLLARGFAFDYNNGAPLVIAPKDGTGRLSAEDKASLASLRAGILALIEPPMLRPRLTAEGELRIGFKTHDRFHWYKPDGQSILKTLEELNAPAVTVRRYTELADGGLHTGSLRDCKGRVVGLAELRFCEDCGWREEK